MAKHTVGCALWSLAIPETVESLRAAARLGFQAVQFAFLRESDLGPAGLRAAGAALEETGLAVPAGMIAFPGESYASIEAVRATGGFAPAGPFPQRLAHCRRVGQALADLGIRHVTTHAGFIPEPGEAGYREVLQRVGRAVDALHEAGLTVGLETGQETAAVLLEVLDDLGREFLSVNFDPANLILYGVEDPVGAARAVARHVTMMHAKDATWSARPHEEWGAEVPLGTGAVDFPGVLGALTAGGFAGPIVIEREAGTDRQKDLAAGRRFLEKLLAQEA